MAATLIALSALAAAAPASAQGPKLGELEIKAYQPIPKTKTAVQLSSDTHLSRELRREVMVRLARRGNEVGFSGGNVMRLDVAYIDLSSGSGGDSGVITGSPSYESPGSNPRMDLPRNKFEQRGGLAPSSAGSTLRITLTLYAVNTGKVIWAATASCIAQGNNALPAGVAIIDNIFDDADKNRRGDAGCPL
ncbi:MAG: hypothetical protein ACHQK9_19230 [Reyranellales bacterium]